MILPMIRKSYDKHLVKECFTFVRALYNMKKNYILGAQILEIFLKSIFPCS